ncbi:hypothetical protein BH10ACI2_BH10ACI2_11410 [soil metagenome]
MNYVTKVADHFLSRCSHISILTPDDFTMIAEWEKRDVPVELVLTTIDAVCGVEKSLESLCDLRDQVRQNYLEWLQSGTSLYGFS